jgi:hypothetical protein
MSPITIVFDTRKVYAIGAPKEGAVRRNTGLRISWRLSKDAGKETR